MQISKSDWILSFSILRSGPEGLTSAGVGRSGPPPRTGLAVPLGEVPAGARNVRFLLRHRGDDGRSALRHLLPPAGPRRCCHSPSPQRHPAGLVAVAAAQSSPGGARTSVERRRFSQQKVTE